MAFDNSRRSPGAPSSRLSFEDATEVWKLKRQGWLQSRIAAHFDCNQGRISEILNHKSHVGSDNGHHGGTLL